MSLICRDGASACTGCGTCLDAETVCDSCRRPLYDGEKYYKFSGKTICPECTDMPKGKLCILCRKPTADGFCYGDVVLCRSCSGVATGYVGYI